MDATVLLGFALGMRHGVDADHLTAIDGLCRLKPRLTSGLYFALGHGLVVTLLAVGIGAALASRLAGFGPWLLIAIGVVSLYRLLNRSSAEPVPAGAIFAQPFLLGMLLAAGFETASQLSALVLVNRTNAWELGAAFCAGMIVVDGLDGYLAASTQTHAIAGSTRAQFASTALGATVVVASFALAASELGGIEMGRFALPIGLSLFVIVFSMRIWSRRRASITIDNTEIL